MGSVMGLVMGSVLGHEVSHGLNDEVGLWVGHGVMNYLELLSREQHDKTFPQNIAAFLDEGLGYGLVYLYNCVRIQSSLLLFFYCIPLPSPSPIL